MMINQDRLNKTAIVDLLTGNEISYGELIEKVESVISEKYNSLEIENKVVILENLSNLDFIVNYYALKKLGAIISPVSQGQDVDLAVSQIKASYVISGASVVKTNIDIAHELTDVSLIPMTSGTSSQSKGALLTKECLESSIKSMNEFFPLKDKMFFAPLCTAHMYGFAVFTSVLNSGGTLVIGSVNKVSDEEIKWLIDMNVHGVFINPFVIQQILNSTNGQSFIEGIKIIGSASAGMPRTVLDRILQINSNISLRLFYALTEVPRAICNVDPHLRGEKYFSDLGTVSEEVSLELLPIKNLKSLKGEQLYEVSFVGPLVAKGYLVDGQAFTFEDGRFCTGDLVTNNDGILTWIGRKSDVLNCDSHSYLASELEQIVYSESSREHACCVVYRNNKIHVVFEGQMELIEKNIELEKVLETLANKLNNDVSLKITAIPNFIRTHNGKIKRSEVRELV